MQENFTLGGRLTRARQYKGLNKSELGALVKTSGTSINNIETGVTQSPKAILLEKIASVLQVNFNWLLNGEGTMLESGSAQEDFILGRQLIPLSEATSLDLPFVPIPARASFIEMAGDQASYGSFEKYTILYPPKEIEGKRAFILEVDGDSMEPQLKRGDKVLAVEVKKGDWVYQTSKVYAVAYGNTFVIKRITNNDLLLNNRLTLSSDNPKGGEITISGNELRGLWRVLKTVESIVE